MGKWIMERLAYILVAIVIIFIAGVLAFTVKSPHNQNTSIFKRDCLRANGVFVNARWDSNGANTGGLKGSMLCLDSSTLVGPKLFTE